ncbi:MAG TPA: T9SS type A sorting domain-containing protein [Bacteroidia bacterium]|jgi:hypothetical protein|nr:T9SS type A sorting domain-containing protein [Bacteroidia bacterium]
MKKIYAIIISVFLGTNVLAQVNPPVYQWVHTITNNTASDGAHSTGIVTDASGNIYMTGIIKGSVTFSGGPSLTSNGGNDFFIAKYDAAGVYQWAYNMGSAAGDEEGIDIKIDNSSNIYISGLANGGTFNFNLAGSAYPTLSGSAGFVAKYDQNGNFVWVTPLGGAITSIDLDNSGNLFAAQYSTNGVSFFKLLCSNGTQVASLGVFCSTGGAFTKIKVDASGNVFAATGFSGTLQATGSYTYVTTAGNYNIAIQKYSNNLAYIWSKQIGGAGSTNLVKMDIYWSINQSIFKALDVAIDNSGNACVVGGFGGNTNFAPTSLTATGTINDGFFAKYNSSTGALMYVKQIQNSGSFAACYKVQIDLNDYINIIGELNGTADFDPSPSTAFVSGTSTAGTTGLFLAKYDGSGNYISAYSIAHDPSITEPYSVYINGSNLYLCGALADSYPRDFDLSAAVANITPTNNNPTGFFAKYNYCSLAPVAPGSISGITTLCSGSSNSYSVASVAGATSYTWSLPGVWTGTSTTNVISATTGTASGSISVSAINACGTSPSQTLSVTVNPNPTITVNSGAICSGQSFTMVAGGASTYTYSSGQVVSPTATSSYSVTGTSTAGCVGSNTAVSNVTVNATPTASASTSQTLTCVNNTVTLNGSGVTSYTWSGPGIVSGGNTANPIVNAAGLYSFVGSTSGCASNTATVTLTSNTTPPSVSIGATSTSVCAGSSTTLSASGANTYSWSTGSLATSIVVSPTTTTSYVLSGTNTANGCSNSANQSITVNPTPTVNAVTSSSLICTQPTQQTATLTASGASTYTWNPGGTGTSIAVSPSVTTTYTVTGTNGSGCMNSFVITQSVSTCAGIKQIASASNEINVFPNPFSNKITVVSNGAKQAIQIFNALGSLIYSSIIENEKTEIDLTEQANGIYFVHLTNSQSSIIKKIIKQ